MPPCHAQSVWLTRTGRQQVLKAFRLSLVSALVAVLLLADRTHSFDSNNPSLTQALV